MVEKEAQKGLIVFQDKNIRRLWLDNEWFYSVTDIIAILTDSQDELAYWRKLDLLPSHKWRGFLRRLRRQSLAS